MDAPPPVREDDKRAKPAGEDVIDVVSDVVDIVVDNVDLCDAASCLDGIDVIPTDCDPGCV